MRALTEAASFDTDPTSSSRVRSIRFLPPANKHSRSACSTTGSRGRLGAAVRMLASTAGKKGGVPGCGNISTSINPDIFWRLVGNSARAMPLRAYDENLMWLLPPQNTKPANQTRIFSTRGGGRSRWEFPVVSIDQFVSSGVAAVMLGSSLLCAQAI
jgi:hypothetical protein